MDCTFKTDEGIFNYRVGLIIYNEDKVLLTKVAHKDSHYFTPGGRVHLHEDLVSAMEREVEEEMHTKLIYRDLAFIDQNFFIQNGVKTHEICFYYKAILEDFPTDKDTMYLKDENGKEFEFSWIKLSELDNINLKPEFLKYRLKDMNEGVYVYRHDL